MIALRPRPPPLAAALFTAVSLQVAAAALPSLGQNWWQKRNVSCLQPAPTGCSALQDEKSCLGAFDGSSAREVQGLRVRGEPCAWCGGGVCHSNSTSVCEPFDFLVRGEGTAFTSFTARTAYRVASCGVTLPTYYNFACLQNESSGCPSLKDAYSCLSARDGRNMTSLFGLKVQGQPCVWCGGVPCHASDSDVLCEPFDFAASASPQDAFPTRRNLRMGICRNEKPASAMLEGIALFTPGYFPPPVGKGLLVPHWVPSHPTEEQMTCLGFSLGGCSALQDADSCLSHRDGGSQATRDGLKVRGEPCVWCGGGACTSGNLYSKCEPFDYVMMGEGTAFTTFFAKDAFSVASCQGSIRKPPFDYECLTKAKTACKEITDPVECLSSTDGSNITRMQGLLVANQPCIWCGGHSCHSGRFTKCEAFDWAVNGEGRAFDQFYAKLTFTMAACTEQQPYPHNYFGPTNETPGVPKWHWHPNPRLAPVVPGGQCGGALWRGSVECQGGYACTPVNGSYSYCALTGTEAPFPAPTSPPVLRLGEDCYEACGNQGGVCSWCGPELACCRFGWPSDPPECRGVHGYTAKWRHECISRRNSANDTSVIGGAVPGAPMGPFWLFFTLAALCCLLPLLLWYLHSIGCGQRERRQHRKTRSISQSSDSDLEDSEGSQSGKDVPLVSRSSGDDLFDLIDANHDGIITEEEYNRAMGAAPAAPVSTMVVGQPVMTQAVPRSPTVAPTLVGPMIPPPPRASAANLGPLMVPAPAPPQGRLDLITVTPWPGAQPGVPRR
uniref:EF-hand domain-containing protein n=1 Tax=Alexandrium monilatum TaxID=311494 RepID=A0A7S4SZC8_9DINO